MYRRLNGEMTKMYPLAQNPFSYTPPHCVDVFRFGGTWKGLPHEGCAPHRQPTKEQGPLWAYFAENERGCDLGCDRRPSPPAALSGDAMVPAPTFILAGLFSK